MTHAESQDLLLDLAYGELDAERAAEVASHVEGCAECRKEKAALEEARRMAAPLRELEEPPAGFDDRILAAARAQAQLEHDGNVGQVIEVSGSVRPMGMEAARIDAHGPVKARTAARSRPRWLVRAAVGGSVAAAAALALVVNTTLETRRNRERSQAARSDDYQIRVQPTAPQSVESALRDAETKREIDRSQSKGARTAGPPEPLRKDKAGEPGEIQVGRKPASTGRVEGSGGEVAARPPAPASAATQRKSDRMHENAKASNEDVVDVEDGPSASGASTAGKASGPQTAPANPAPLDQVPASSAAPPPRPEKTRPAMKSVPERAVAGLTAPTPAAVVEANAQQARHGGDYVRAASLYRQAAGLRQRENDAPGAAWDLAHAVECLSAVGQFGEARGVRDELGRSYPSETGALSAARRALREPEPQTAPASN